MKRYIKNALIGLDQFANTLLGGIPGETISARTGRMAHAGKRWALILRSVLNHIQPNHVEGAEAGDFNRAATVERTECSDPQAPIAGDGPCSVDARPAQTLEK